MLVPRLKNESLTHSRDLKPCISLLMLETVGLEELSIVQFREGYVLGLMKAHLLLQTSIKSLHGIFKTYKLSMEVECDKAGFLTALCLNLYYKLTVCDTTFASESL